MTDDIVESVWHQYHLRDVHHEHPLRQLCELARRLRGEHTVLSESVADLTEQLQNLTRLLDSKEAADG